MSTRRDFLAATGAAVVAGTGLASGTGSGSAGRGLPDAFRSGATGGQSRAGPDLVLLGGAVHTMDVAVPKAEAFAVTGGRFVAVGTTEEIRRLATPTTEVIDARGTTVFPGFIDAHCHPDGVDELTGVNVNLPSIADIQAAMKKRAAATPAELWVTGVMYDDTKLSDGRPITRRDLDQAVPDHPAMVQHRGGHTLVANSKAFALAGITAAAPDPANGKIYRENGELTGKVAESAQDLFYGVGKRPEITPELRRRAVAALSAAMAKAGITSVHSAGGSRADLTALEDAIAAGELRFRMYFFPSRQLYPGFRASGIRTGFGDEVLRIGPVKFVADGSASERTMRMSTPYVGRPSDFGILTMSQQEIHDAVEEAHRGGWRVAIHANGDVTIDMVLNAYERVQKLWPKPDVRHRIEHCTLVNPDLLRRIKAAGVIPAPFYTYVYYHGEKWAEYGEEKVRWMFAHRSFLDSGIPVAPASDYMPGPYEPLMAIQSMVTRTDYKGRVWGGNQKITVPEALRICTVNGAYASKEERTKGAIVPGMLADFAMLARDPHTEEPARIKDIPVLRTVLGGRTTHHA
ncbi:MAG TPA: amidohydrolase [Gemmatimonadales bacterium]|nr:amidohydrolase [Gemmatimonadales bacterium]